MGARESAEFGEDEIAGRSGCYADVSAFLRLIATAFAGVVRNEGPWLCFLSLSTSM